MSPAFPQGVDPGLNHIRGCIEVGLANFQMNDFLARTLQRTRLVQDLKGRFRAQSRHTLSQMKFVLCGFIHRRKTGHYTPPGLMWARASALVRPGKARQFWRAAEKGRSGWAVGRARFRVVP